MVMYMYNKMDLMILSGVIDQEKSLANDVKEYKELIKRKVLFFGKKERRLKKQSVRKQIVDLTDIVIKYENLFNNSHTKEFYDELMNLLNTKVNDQGEFSETEGVSFSQAIKNEVEIQDRMYFQLYEFIHLIVLFTKNTLTIEELNFVRGKNDIRWHSSYKR